MLQFCWCDSFILTSNGNFKINKFLKFLAAIFKGPIFNGPLNGNCQGGSTSKKFPESLKMVFCLLVQLNIKVQDASAMPLTTCIMFGLVLTLLVKVKAI